MKYCKTKPCNNCPYRKDAPLRHWDVKEFTNLLEKDSDIMGALFGCHKKDGNVCVGWLMNQDKRNLPSIALRISLSKNNITVEYLDSLKSDSEMYGSVKEMILANYPELNNVL